MVMIATRRKKRCLATVALGHIKSQHIAVEAERTFEVRNLEVNVPDSGLRRNWTKFNVCFHELKFMGEPTEAAEKGKHLLGFSRVGSGLVWLVQIKQQHLRGLGRNELHSRLVR